MDVLILSASPNDNGLTAACAGATRAGAQEAGASVQTITLNYKSIAACGACNDGWGPCRTEHECVIKDDFQAVHAAVLKAGALVLISPVYWGEMSESAKKFTDKLRRCEATKGDASGFKNKPVICVAAAGGSGNGCVTCLASMERLVDHVRGAKHGLFGITRRTRPAVLPAIREAARGMVMPTEG